MSYGILKHSKAKMQQIGRSKMRSVTIQVRIERVVSGWKGATPPKFSASACMGGAQRGGYTRDPLHFAGSRRCVWHVEGATPTKAMKKAVIQLMRRTR